MIDKPNPAWLSTAYGAGAGGAGRMMQHAPISLFVITVLYVRIRGRMVDVSVIPDCMDCNHGLKPFSLSRG